jgi:RNA 3'-terminal phosphate cyclase (ATP)
LREVTLPALAPFGSVQLKLEKRGYYPAGQGAVEVMIKGNLPRGNEPWERFAQMLVIKHPVYARDSRPRLQRIKGVAHASIPGAAGAMAEAARLALSRTNVPVDIRVEDIKAASAGGGITLWAIFSDDEVTDASPRIGASGLLTGKKDMQTSGAAAKVGKEAAEQLLKDIASPAPADAHLADQLVPFLALCNSGKVVTTGITTHTRTNIDVVKQVLGVALQVKGTTITKF